MKVTVTIEADDSTKYGWGFDEHCFKDYEEFCRLLGYMDRIISTEAANILMRGKALGRWFNEFP